MIYKIKYENTNFVDCARTYALNMCIIRNPSLYEEFRAFCGDELDHNQIFNKLTEFQKFRGLKIVSEKPEVRIVDDRYIVDVEFEVEY